MWFAIINIRVDFIQQYYFYGQLTLAETLTLTLTGRLGVTLGLEFQVKSGVIPVLPWCYTRVTLVLHLI